MTLRVHIIDSVEKLDEAEPRWIDFLQRRAGEYTIHQDPRIFRAFIDKEGGRSAPLCLLIYRGDDLVCVAPFFTFDGEFRINLSVVKLAQLPARMLKLVSDRFVFSDDAPIDDCVISALTALEQAKDRFAYIMLPELTMPNEIVESLERHQGKLGGFSLAAPKNRTEKAHAHWMAADYDAYLASLGAKKRKNIRRDTKAWREEEAAPASKANGKPKKNKAGKPAKGHLVTVTEVNQVKWFLERVEHIYPRTWQGKTFGYWKRDSPGEIRYLTAFAELGWLRSYLLETNDGTPVAFIMGYQGPTDANQAGGRYHYEDIGYDLAFSNDHPGVALSYFMMEDLYTRRPPRVVDFGYGDNRYKEALANEQREARSLYLVASPRWRATLFAQRGLDKVYTEAKRLAQRAGIETRVRDLLKKRSASGAEDQSSAG